MNQKFSILTSYYNKKEYIKDWFNSIKVQTYRPLEVVFVNDGCRDLFPLWARDMHEKFKSKGITFEYIYNRVNLGCASSYMNGFNRCTGDYVGILDSDDMLSENAVESVMNAYQSNPTIGHIWTQFIICDPNMNVKKKGFCREPDPCCSLVEMANKGFHCYSHWRTFSRLIPDIGKIWRPGLKMAVDKYMGYKLEELAPGMFMDEVCYLYRDGTKGCITSKGKTKRTWHKMVEEFIKNRQEQNIQCYPIIKK